MSRNTMVVVVAYNSSDDLPACLAALAADGQDMGRVVVADNASADRQASAAATAAAGARFLPLDTNGGYAAGINAGAALAGPDDDLLVLNPDVRLRPGALAALRAALAQPGTGIAAPRLVDRGGRTHRSLRRAPTVARALGEALLGGRLAGRIPALGEVVTSGRAYVHAGTADWATGAALLVSAACRRAVGDWDESFFLYSEETDFALRARDAGFALRYAPAAVAEHDGGEWAQSERLWALLTVNRVRLHRRRNGVVAGALFGAAVALNEAKRAALGSRVHRAGLRALLRPSARPAELRRDAAEPGYICFSAQDWWYHNHGHSDIQLMRRVARERPVLFVNSIGMRMPLPGRSTFFLRRILRKVASVARMVRRPLPDTPGFAVMTPLVLPFYASPFWRQVNARLVALQVRVASRALGIRTPVYVVTIPTAWEVLHHLPEGRLVVNRADKFSAYEETDQAYIARCEDALLRRAVRVVYAGLGLMTEEAPLVGERGYFLDHGVDLEHFRPRHLAQQEPADMRPVPRPRIGYFGGLDDYLVDFKLLERLADEIPEAQLVLIGDSTYPMDALAARPNVVWLGARPYEVIPDYGSAFDVALMPFQDNEWIRSSNPIKLKEYLALGLPVVSTDFPQARAYARWIEVAGDHDTFVDAVRRLLAADPSDATTRRAAVAGDSWDRRAAQLMAVAEG